jgi:hypothetical protein
MPELFQPWELGSVADMLRGRFGTDTVPTDDRAWKGAEIKSFLDSSVYALRNYMMTADPSTGRLSTLDPYTGQAILAVAKNSQKRRELPQYILEMKPRQVGWTTWILGDGLHTAMHPNRKCLILVDDEDVADEKSVQLGTMINSLPRIMQPMRRIQNLKHLVFDNPNPKQRIENPGLNSNLQITVPSSFRGNTPHFLALSEFAFYNDDVLAQVTQGLIPAMALSELTCVYIDTTPNGFDDYYYPMAMESIERNKKWIRRIEKARNLTAQQVLDGALGEPDRPDAGFVPAVSFWFMHEAYTTRDDNPRGQLPRLSASKRGELEADLGRNTRYGGAEEVDLRDEKGVSLQRLYWRRRKIDSYELPTPELKLLTFRQEFTSSIHSMFVTYGNSPFDRESLDALMRQEREPIAVGRLERGDDNRIGIRTSAANEWLRINFYAPPEQGQQYTMGVDCGVAYESPTSDASVAQILRFSDYKVCATLIGRVPDYILREQLYLLYQWYMHCYYAVELKGIGYQLMRSLVDMGASNYYSWKRLDAELPEPSRYPGWETSAKTRPIMDETMVELISHRNRETNACEPNIIIPDAYTLREIQSLARQPSGAVKSSSGHDDAYDALAIAACIAQDPYGGLHKKGANVAPTREERSDFNRLFKTTVFGRRDRNHPDLSRI